MHIYIYMYIYTYITLYILEYGYKMIRWIENRCKYGYDYNS